MYAIRSYYGERDLCALVGHRDHDRHLADRGLQPVTRAAFPGSEHGAGRDRRVAAERHLGLGAEVTHRAHVA